MPESRRNINGKDSGYRGITHEILTKFLGQNYTVKAAGHLRDPPKSTLGVTFLPDEEHANEFEPKYINIRGKGDLIKSLKAEAKSRQSFTGN